MADTILYVADDYPKCTSPTGFPNRHDKTYATRGMQNSIGMFQHNPEPVLNRTEHEQLKRSTFGRFQVVSEQT